MSPRPPSCPQLPHVAAALVAAAATMARTTAVTRSRQMPLNGRRHIHLLLRRNRQIRGHDHRGDMPRPLRLNCAQTTPRSPALVVACRCLGGRRAYSVDAVAASASTSIIDLDTSTDAASTLTTTAAAPPLAVGDLVGIRRFGRSYVGVLVKVSTDSPLSSSSSSSPSSTALTPPTSTRNGTTLATDYYTVLADGHHVRHLARDVIFRTPAWAFSSVVKKNIHADPAIATAMPPSSSTSKDLQRAAPAAKAPPSILALSSESQELLAAADLNANVVRHLARFQRAAEEYAFRRKDRFISVYNNFRHLPSFTIEQAAAYVFGPKLKDLKGTDIATLTPFIPSPAECYATFCYLCANPKFFVPYEENIRDSRRFSPRDHADVDAISWLEEHCDRDRPDTDALDSFLAKAKARIEWAQSIDYYKRSEHPPRPPPNITFTKDDQRFIAAIRSAAFGSYGQQNPYASIVSRSILANLPGYAIAPSKFNSNDSGSSAASSKGQECIRLLKDLGVFAPAENTAIFAVAARGGATALAAVDGYGVSGWADTARAESEAWARVLLDGPELQPDSSSSAAADADAETDSAAAAAAATHAEHSATPRLIAERLHGKTKKSPREADQRILDLANQIRGLCVFPQEVVNDSFNLTDACAHIRHDFGNMPVYVIDSPTAHELDDGISIEPTGGDGSDFWIHVHIADPSAYIPPAHPLSLLAQLRGTSIYFPERHHPMLPDSLSLSRFSLRGGGSGQCALTFSARIGSDGEILDHAVKPSFIRNVHVMHYRDINDVIGWKWDSVHGISMTEEERSPWVHKALTELPVSDATAAAERADLHGPDARRDLIAIKRIMERHFARRISVGGGFLSDSPGSTIKVRPEVPVSPVNPSAPMSVSVPRIDEIALDPNHIPHVEPASSMVAEAMILAGRVAARFAASRNLNVLYRGQTLPPSPSTTTTTTSNISARIQDTIALHRDPRSGVIPFEHFTALLRNAFPAALTSSTPIPHLAMGITDGYLKVTSPLRRFRDLMAHHSIIASLLGRAQPYRAQDLASIDARLTPVERWSSRAMRSAQRQWTLEWIRRAHLTAHEVSVRAHGELVVSAREGLVECSPRTQNVWGSEYKGRVQWTSRGPVACRVSPFADGSPLRVLLSNVTGRRVDGCLVDLGGVEGRVIANAMVWEGDVVECVVESVDPPAGVLVLRQV